MCLHRNFRCDCGNSKFKQQCKLYPVGLFHLFIHYYSLFLILLCTPVVVVLETRSCRTWESLYLLQCWLYTSNVLSLTVSCFGCPLNVNVKYVMGEIETFSFFYLLGFQDKEQLNSQNKYSHNFFGLYCTCNRPYPDPEDQVPCPRVSYREA